MSRYRLNPTPAQEAVLPDHCGHARYIWNLAVDALPLAPGPQQRAGLPGTVPAAHRRASRAPMAGGRLQTVQQQALRDFTQATAAFFDPANPAGRPSWRKAWAAMRDSGSSAAGGSGTCAACPATSARSGCPRPGGSGSAGPAPVPPDAKSYRVTKDRAGRWHVAFAVTPAPVPAPGNGQVVGIDRGVDGLRGPVHRATVARPRPDRAGTGRAAAPAAQARPR